MHRILRVSHVTWPVTPLYKGESEHCAPVSLRFCFDDFMDVQGTLTGTSLPPVPAAAVNKRRSLFVVGDPDQAIYGWRGAVTNSMHSMFSKDFPHSQVRC